MHFSLQKTLPLLRAQSRSQPNLQLLQHVPQAITPQKILPQQHPVQPKNTSPANSTSAQIQKQQGHHSV